MTALPDFDGSPTRRLSHVLAKITLLLALVLGAVSGGIQIWVDLRQEKDAVQYSAEEFLTSVAPSAASAAYNFYGPAAEQVAEGLFTQRAITSVKILNEGQVMISRERDIVPTLPRIGQVTEADPVVLEQPLMTPPETGRSEVIGAIIVTVDRSVVAPAFVNRMVFYFVFATVKNFLLGILLILIVYGALARHIVSLADTTRRWRPGSDPLRVDNAPRLLRGTELDLLSHRLRHLTDAATGRINEIEASREAAMQTNTELSQKSESLSQEVREQNIQLQRANARLRELAETDALTGLYNRGSFDRMAAAAVERACAKGSEVAVMLIDVDHFKNYNDYYGHQAGDRCLVEVAGLLRSVLETAHSTVARYGGEEFIALFEGCSARDADELADELHFRLRQASVVHQRSPVAGHVTVSVGVAAGQSAGPPSTTQLHHLIAHADEALYEAKRHGRNRTVVSTDELRNRVEQKRNKARDLLTAVDARAFEPFFQPQFNAVTGRMVGAETLVRWRREDGTYASPAVFFEIARANGYLPLIDQIVLEQVSAFLEQVQHQGLSVPRLALNTPRANLLERRYTKDVVALARAGGTKIALELLETEAGGEPDDVFMWQLEALRAENVEIEIDNFGTGHTSVLSLMGLRPSRVKIAREIISLMRNSGENDDIVDSIVRMGRSMGVEVIAEGVEDADVSERLVRLGCPVQQGYFFARPMPAADFLKALPAFGQRLGA